MLAGFHKHARHQAALLSSRAARGVVDTQEGARAYLCPSTLSDTDNPVLVGVEDLPHFAHRLGVCGGGGEVPIQVQPAKQTSPAVVALSSVG